MLKLYAQFVRRHALIFGLVAYSLFCWGWILQIDLGKLASSSGAGKLMQGITVLILTTLSTVIYVRSLKLLFGVIEKTKKWLVPIKLAAWWAGTELFVAWAVSIVWYGTGARIDNVLPFMSLSHFGVWTPLGYLSRFVGLYGLSGVMFMLAVLLVKPNFRKLFRPMLAVVTLLTLLAWEVYRVPNGPSVSVVVVTDKNEQDVYEGPVQPKDGELVLFPEYSFTDIESGTVGSKITTQGTNQKGYFVGSRFVYGGTGVKNQLVAGDTENGYSNSIDKSRLIPMGEYLPYATVAVLRAIGAREVIENFKQTREIVKAEGDPEEALLRLGEITAGAGICSSIIAPEDYRNLAKHGATLFTNSAFLGIFNDSALYEWHHKSMAKSMAMANARTFLQSARSGTSYGFDANGKQLFSREETGLTEVSAELNSRKTPYSLFGEYLGYGGLVWIFINFLKLKDWRRYLAKLHL